jgi:hypothetical protein
LKCETQSNNHHAANRHAAPVALFPVPYSWECNTYGYWTNPSLKESITLSITGNPYVVNSDTSIGLRPVRAYGAMTGVRIHLNDRWRLLAEAQYRNGFTGTAGFGYAF